jgi:DNA-binding response OmpR family regulator
MHTATIARDPLGLRTRLLIVEDELSTVFALRSFFALAGYEVDCAAGPRDALMLLDRHEYDAIITDLQLTPRRDAEGFAVAERARERNPGACVVMLTAYGCDATEQRAKRCGVDLYHTKPIELPHLMARIDGTLAERWTCRRG